MLKTDRGGALFYLFCMCSVCVFGTLFCALWRWPDGRGIGSKHEFVLGRGLGREFLALKLP